MKDFLKYLFASILGCSIVLGIFFFFLLVSIASFSISSLMAVGSGTVYDLKDNTVLTLKLDGTLLDRSKSNPIQEILYGNNAKEIVLTDVIGSIKKAKENDKIRGIYISVGNFSANPASVKEIRDELVKFKKSGKFIVSYGDTYSQQSYYLCTIADKVILNPYGMLQFEGYASTPTFYKGLLDKLGIKMQIFKVGTFKSAIEPFVDTQMSDANRFQVKEYLNDLWYTSLKDISKSRNMTTVKLNILADSLPLLRNTEFLINNGLIDDMMYETEIKDYLKELLDLDKKEEVRYVSIMDMTTVPYKIASKSKDLIAVLFAEGDILDGESTSDINSKYYVEELESLKSNNDVKAVVFRVNSPGGSAYASEQIWKAVSDLKEKKPVIVSMGNYAASGGYYISCNATQIFAQPNTITGSIGIYGMIPSFEGLSNEVGLTHDRVKTNKFSDFGDLSRNFSAEEANFMQKRIEYGYDLFLTRCADGRNMSKEALNNVAQGRVWTGNQALKLGLVDAIGGIDDALEEAAKLADLHDYTRINLPANKDFFTDLFSNYKDYVMTSILNEQLGSEYKYFRMVKSIKEQDMIQARMSYDFDIK